MPVPVDSVTPWRHSTRGTAVRLFLTCWLVYGLHFATNIVREIYPALALGDHFSFRLDEYANMHVDLFEKPGYGWHSGNNPGVSMIAAIPYAMARPIIDRVVARVQAQRARTGQDEPPAFESPWPMAREFYSRAWRRGYDVKFGLGAFVMHAFCMAPISALGIVVMFYALRRVFGADRSALWLALLYAFGTPVFFRSGYLNHNLMMGHFLFMGFLAMWNPSASLRWSSQARFFVGGLAGGTTFLFDNSGIVLLSCLFAYGVVQRWRLAPPGPARLGDVTRHAAWYVAGTAGPVALLWFYQWKSFGHPFYPGQHWMPPVEWIELGYQGVGFPQLSLLAALLFDYRFGLFVTGPIFLFALFSPMVNRVPARVPRVELMWMLGLSLVLIVFFSGVNYTRLQYNTGIRYLAPLFPFLFLPAALVVAWLPSRLRYFVAVLCVIEAWCLAMHRDVERGLGVLDPIVHVFVGGFELPILTTLSRASGQFGEFVSRGVTPVPLFLLAAAVLYGIWAPFSQTDSRSPADG
jgi:hypothetical protein